MKKFLFIITLFSFNYMYGQYGVNERGFKLEGGYYSCNDNDYELVSIDRFSKIWYDNESRNEHFWVSREYYESGRPKNRSMVTNYDHPVGTVYKVDFNSDGVVTNIWIGYGGGGSYEHTEISYPTSGENNLFFDDQRSYLIDNWKEQIEELGNYYFNICEIDKSINPDNLSIHDEIDGIEDYDKLLNRYYQILKKQFSKEEFGIIKLDQQKWLKKRGDKIIKQYWTESVQVIVTSQLELYKTRVKELINLFYVKLDLPIDQSIKYNLPGGGQKIEYTNLYGETLYFKCYDKWGYEIPCK